METAELYLDLGERTLSFVQQRCLEVLENTLPSQSRREWLHEGFGLAQHEQNPNLADYLVGLQQGIDVYRQKHPEAPPHWHQHEEYMSTGAYMRMMTHPLSEEQANQVTEIWVNGGSMREIDQQQGVKTLTKNPLFVSLMQSMHHDRGYDYRSKNLIKAVILPSLHRALSEAEDTTTEFGNVGGSFVDKDVDVDNEEAFAHQKIKVIAYYEESRNLIEQTFADNPATTAQLVAFFLERTQGDLVKALFDLAGVMKYMSRDCFHTLDNGEELANQWMQRYVLDEFSDIKSFNEIDASQHPDLVNKLRGERYHADHIVALLHFFPPGSHYLFCVGGICGAGG